MRKIFLTVVSVILVHVSFCQIPISPKDADKAKNLIEQPLLVKLISADEDVLKKLNEEEKVVYHKQIEDYNNVLKTSITKYWTLHQNPTFLTVDKLNETVEKGDRDYAILTYQPFEGGQLGEKSDASTTPYTYSLSSMKKGDVNQVIRFSVVQRAETEADFRFILLNLSKYLSAEAAGKPYKDPSLYDKEQNFKILTEKTLLLTIDQLDTTKISREVALKNYPHANKLKFVSMEEIYKAVDSQDQNSLYLTYILNEPKHVWMLAIVDPSNMNIIEMQSLARVHFAIGRQFVGIENAKSMAAKYGGSFYNYQQPFTIWQSRATTKMSDKDFKILGSKLCVGFNY